MGRPDKAVKRYTAERTVYRDYPECTETHLPPERYERNPRRVLSCVRVTLSAWHVSGTVWRLVFSHIL